MASLTFYGGAREIGGNKILLEAGDTTLFLDFGTSFARRSLFYEEFLPPRSIRGLLDPLTLGLIPPLRGIYRSDLELPQEEAWQHVMKEKDIRELKLDGVLLSHAHLDHSGYISFLRPEIPIYSSTMTAFVVKAIQDSGRSDFESEVCYAIPKECDGVCIKSTNYRQVPSRQRPFKVFDYLGLSEEAKNFWQTTPGSRGHVYVPLEKADKCKGIDFRWFPVDHSLFGASAFGVKTGEGWIMYTGDLRLHGARKALTEKFIDDAAKLEPLALICEGTNVDINDVTTEEEVLVNSKKAVENTRGLVIADFGPRNVERLLTFRRVAEETGRMLVLLSKDVYLLEAMKLVDPTIPDFSSDAVCLLYDEAKGRVEKWEERLREDFSGHMTSPQDIRKNQENFIVCMSFWDLNEFPDLAPEPGGSYIYSTSEAFNEEQIISFTRLKNWLSNFRLTMVGDPEKGEKGFHATGHIIGPQLRNLIRAIRPKYLFPVHTEKPEFFLQNLEGETKVIIPRYSETVNID